jgi:hypothetical protein
MLNRWSLLLLMLGVITGYLISGTSLRAQVDPLPFAVGNFVTLHYGEHPGSNFVECSVMEIRGTFVKCAPAAGPLGERVEAWRSLQSVAMVKKY